MKKKQTRMNNTRSKAWRFVHNVGEHWQLWLLALPAIAYVAVFCYKPMYGIQIAFRDYKAVTGITGSKWVGLYNFERLISNYWFPIILKNTLTLSLMSLILGFPMPIILSLMVNELEHSGIKRAFQTITYAPHFISTIVLCGMVILFLSPSSGIINFALKAMGKETVNFMQKPAAYKWIYVLSGIWQGTGWSCIIYYAALSGVDKSLLEAAEIDGATKLQRIIYVNFPVLVPTIVILFVLQCGSLLSVGYEKVYALQNSVNLTASEVISTYVYKQGMLNFEFSLSTAANLFNSIVNTAILVFANQMSKMITKNSLW